MTDNSGSGRSVSRHAILTPPNGLEQILATFGDIYQYIRTDGSLDPRWQSDFLTGIELPFPLQLAWDRSRAVSRMTCHVRTAGIFAGVFGRIHASGLQNSVPSFGGCFAFRKQRTGAKLSTHSWGIAIDLNSGTNAQGSAGNMAAELVEIFRNAGFEWGGAWAGRSRDPMHFQFCTGY